jgi:diguanylate cyclase
MRGSLKLTLQIAVLVAVVALGAFYFIEVSDSALGRACVLSLMALGLVGFGINEIETKGLPLQAAAGAGAPQSNGPTPQEQQFAGALTVIVKLIETYLRANSKYSDSLESASRDLAFLERPEQVRAVVALLIDENEKMREEVGELSKGLEASRSQVATLQSNLAEVTEISMRDPLTMLGNRRFFDTQLSKEVTEAHDENSDICLALADIDEFKKINDRFGHQVGDMVLKRFGELLTKYIDGRDTAARYGGEEFAIIFPCTTLPDATHIVDRIRTELEAKQWILSASGQKLGRVTASFGLAQLRENEEAQSLLKRADTKLYEAKLAGRNRIEIDRAA